MKNKQGLLGRVLTLGIGAALSKAAVFLLMPLYTAALTPEGFGRAEIIINTALLLLPLATLSAPEAVFRFLADESERGVVRVGWRMLGCGLGLFALLMPLLSLFAALRPYLLYLLCYVVAAALHSFFSHILRARGSYTLYAAQQLFCTLLTVGLSVLFLPILGLGERGYLAAIFLADAVTALLIALYLKLCGGAEVGQGKPQGMLRYALPLIPTAALWWSISYFDRFVLLSASGASAIGLYAAAGRIPSLLTFGAGLFCEAWQYAVLHTAGEGRQAMFQRIYAMLRAGLVAAALGFVLFSRFLVEHIFAADFAGASRFVPFLTLGALFSALSSFLGSVYLVRMQTRASLSTALLGAGVSLILCLWWIPLHGTMGAVMATVCAYLAIFLRRSRDATRAGLVRGGDLRFLVAVLLLTVTAGLVTVGRHALAIPVAAAALLLFLREYCDICGVLWRKAREFLQKIRKKEQKNQKKDLHSN